MSFHFYIRDQNFIPYKFYYKTQEDKDRILQSLGMVQITEVKKDMDFTEKQWMNWDNKRHWELKKELRNLSRMKIEGKNKKWLASCHIETPGFSSVWTRENFFFMRRMMAQQAFSLLSSNPQ